MYKNSVCYSQLFKLWKQSTKEAEILLINLSETVNNFFNHDSTEAYDQNIILGAPFSSGLFAYQVYFSNRKKYPADFYLCDPHHGNKTVKSLCAFVLSVSKGTMTLSSRGQRSSDVLRWQLNKIILEHPTYPFINDICRLIKQGDSKHVSPWFDTFIFVHFSKQIIWEHPT